MVGILILGASLVDNSSALANVTRTTSLKDLRTIIANAKASIAARRDVETSRQVLDAAASRLWELSAAKHDGGAAVDRALWEALYAYEYLMSDEAGRSYRATYLRRKIVQTDIVTAVSGSVLKGGKTTGLQALRDMGRLDASFEAVVLKFRSTFPADVIEAAQKTLSEFG
jgi:hypothetical protein